jgi:hypothetical protein
MDTFCSDDIKELAGAMLKVQSELNPAVNDASIPSQEAVTQLLTLSSQHDKSVKFYGSKLCDP